MVLVCGILFLLSYVFLQIANAGELDDIKKAIKEKGAKWTAGDTSVSNLPDNEKKLRAGTIISGEEAKGAKALSTVNLPTSWNWCAYNNGNYVTPIKDQGSCGSCWAFGSIAQLESVEEIYYAKPNQNIDLSEQYLVSCVKCTGCRGCGGCNGCDMVSAYNFLVNKGTTDEINDQYLATKSSCPKKVTITAKLSRWDPVLQDVGQLKAAVYNHPITVAFNVYNDFFSYTGGIYSHVSGALAGGHAVCIVGWDDSSSCFIVKNSWGTGWGEDSFGITHWDSSTPPNIINGGYFRIAYSQITNEVSFGRAAGNFALVGTSPAPPNTANPEKTVSFWGTIKNTY